MLLGALALAGIGVPDLSSRALPHRWALAFASIRIPCLDGDAVGSKSALTLAGIGIPHLIGRASPHRWALALTSIRVPCFDGNAEIGT